MQTDDQFMTIYLEATQPQSDCPLCGKAAEKIQSRYQRKLADLNWADLKARLVLQVRRFYCPNVECSRKIFCERLTILTQAYARRTNRLTQRLLELALSLGGRPAERLAAKINLPARRSSLLRLLDNKPSPAYPTPRVLGVDDFALRKGHNWF